MTLHPWLGYQNLVDGPSRSFAYPGEIIDNFSLGRASTEALIPKQTSCVGAINSIIPGMNKKISSKNLSQKKYFQTKSQLYINSNYINHNQSNLIIIVYL